MKTLAEAKAFLEANQVKFVLAQFVDMHGAAKTKALPASHFEDILTTGAGFAGFAIWGFGMNPSSHDLLAIGDLATLSLVPWMPGFARIACNCHVDGQPYAYDARVVLLNQLEKLKAQGLTLYTGLEPEFALLKKDQQGRLHPFDSTDVLEKPCYDYKGLSRSTPFLEKLVSSLQSVGFDVYQIDHEDASGQFEINYTYTDCLTSCDRFIFFKMAASEIAKEFGMVCTFMPKPVSNRSGSGMHIHMSLSDGQQNLFSDDSDPRGLGLSQLAYHFLGGLLAHAPALTAVCAPTVNSYKRLVVGRSLSGATWAPAYISYGDNNRSSMVRIPGGRLEFRLADSACNPYLATTVALAAGLDGIAKQLDPGEPQNINLYGLSLEELAQKGIHTLPQNLNDAIAALESDSVITEALGVLAAEFIDLKRMEWVEYMRHVSDWEVERYLELF
ncbi:MAG: type III glutamate--ammonia ligase [Aphanocapsa sp. GSE-SYN-MK-11-07L]|jgi:glutamine synthetase|nr:type III glutamate--ammonia ligase [Aphanocapsa sp. GSE-SYN-MK-11-07L]